MAIQLPTFEGVCAPVPMGPGEFCVTLPGGVLLCAYEYQDTGDAGAIVNSLLGQIGTALAPLAPFFNVLEFVKAVFDTLKAIPDAILTLNPQPIVESLVGLGVAVDKLLALIPQYSVPVMIKGILGVVVQGLIGVRAQMQAMIIQAARVQLALDRAASSQIAPLMVIAQCAQDNLETQLVNLNASYSPLNRMIALMNFFLELAGLPCIPVLGALPSIGSPALDVIDTTIALLQTILAALPGLDTALAALPASGCA